MSVRSVGRARYPGARQVQGRSIRRGDPAKDVSFRHCRRRLRWRKGLSKCGRGLHDLRRTFASMLAEADVGIAESGNDAVLNHAESATRGGVTGFYERSQRQAAQDRVVEAWARQLDRIIDGVTADVHAGARA